ncbi:MAG TPA: glycosyltransferase, partial [Myxococcaceae bacterium]|nr:glycosyltransferase [Myxococcaceae bacterium]
MSATPLRLVEFTRSFYLGGTEGQVVELVRGLKPRYDLRIAVLQEVGPLAPDIRAMGFAPESFPLNGSAARPNTAVQAVRLARWLKKTGAQLLHVHDFYATLIAVPAARMAGCRVVVGRLDLAHWHGRARRAALSALTHAASHVVANADAVREMLVQEERLPPSRVTVIRNGIDLPRFDAQRAAGLASPLPEVNGEPVAVLVANMNHPVKRQEDFLEAVARVRARRPLQAFLVGDGPRRPALEQKASELGVAHAVHFLKHRQDIPAVYAQAAVGVLCSDAEGLSNAIIEGMASRLPMVVTDAGGNAELVQDGERGWVVPKRDPSALAEALLR